MNHKGLHVIADIYVNEPPTMAQLKVDCTKALDISDMTVLGQLKHDFGGGAFTAVYMLAESHMTIHTFPERNYISLDCYTCGSKGKPMKAVEHMISNMDIKGAKIQILERV